MPITHSGRTTPGTRRLLAAAVAALAVLTGGRDSTVGGQGQAPPILLVVNSAAPNPFGPYLAMAGWVTMLWGDEIMRHYLQMAQF